MKSWLRAMDGPTFICLVLVALASAASLNAQQTVDAQEPEAGEMAAEAVEPTDPECPAQAKAETVTLAKMTPVYIRLNAELDSKTSASGETFPITVNEPVMLDGREVIPVGATGEGEVIHAKKAGGSGAAGELILTATHLNLGDQVIPLRSMKLGLSGKDQTGLAIASSVVPGLGFLIKGKNITVPEGSLAGAKLAEDTQILIGESNKAADLCEGRDEE